MGYCRIRTVSLDYPSILQEQHFSGTTNQRVRIPKCVSGCTTGEYEESSTDFQQIFKYQLLDNRSTEEELSGIAAFFEQFYLDRTTEVSLVLTFN